MSNYTIDELIARWKKEEMTAEQMIGQILLVLKQQEARMKETRRETSGATVAAEQRR